jgi:hypothetical protein
MGLKSNQYVASHLRALYDTDDRSLAVIEKFTSNALDCASQLRPGMSIYFASDSSDATSHALKIGHPAQAVRNIEITDNQYAGPRVVTSTPIQNPPWHLDKYIGPPERFFDTFIDLYLMAEARCVTYNKGGFGHWALLIGGNIECSSQQDIIGSHGTMLMHPCRADSSITPNMELEAKRQVVRPLYLPPMKD